MSHDSNPPTIIRQAVRALVVDDRKRLLMIRCRDPKLENAPTFWISPGGGIEADESPLQALARELHEEVGLDVHPQTTSQCVWHRRHLFHFNGKRYDQREQFFYCPINHHHVTFVGQTADELTFLEDYHWWSLDELNQTHDQLAPSNLPQYLPALLQGELPNQPIDVSA